MTNLLGMCMRWLYSGLIRLALPWANKRLAKETVNQFSAAQRKGHLAPFAQPVIWAHCASVGEVVAAAPLLNQLLELHPNKKLVVTTMTATGAARVKELLPQAAHSLLPLDLPSNTHRFIQTLNPLIGIIFETEIWPNLYHSCAKAGVPLILTNGRISPSTLKTYLKIRPLIAEALTKLTFLAAKSEADAQAFLQLGANPDKLTNTGTLKFDLQLPENYAPKLAELEQQLNLGQRPVWIAASTNAGEEELILQAQQQVLAQQPEALLILVPRHPQRFESIANLIKQQGFSLAQRSQGQIPSTTTQVYLGDTLGELLPLYALANLAFVAGSLLPNLGGHNLLEPALVGTPVITGMHIDSVSDMAAVLLEDEALIQVEDAQQLANTVLALWKDAPKRQAMQQAAYKVIQANKGALERQLKIIEQELARNSLG